MPLTKDCLVCGKQFIKKQNCSLKDWEITKFCCPQCYYKSKIGKPTWNKGKKGVQKNINIKGFKKGWELNGKQNIGKVPWNKGKRYKNPKNAGKNAWNWKGGITSERDKFVSDNFEEYSKWRKQVFERDDYTCQHCKKKGGELNADHIKPFSRFPHLRLDINNGRTLCIACHRLTSTYGGKIKSMSF